MSGSAGAAQESSEDSPQPATIAPPVVCGAGGTTPVQTGTAGTELPAYQAIVSPVERQTRTISHTGATLKVPPAAVSLPVGIGIMPLQARQLPPLDPGMTNVTGKQRGSGIEGGAEPGRNVYLQRISYTGQQDAEGRYEVNFVRTGSCRSHCGWTR